MADNLTKLPVSKVAEAAEDLTTEEAIEALQAEADADGRAGALDAIFAEHRDELVEALIDWLEGPPPPAAGPTPVAAPAPEGPSLHETKLGSLSGLLTIIPVDVIVNQWGAVSNSPIHYVDINGEHAEYLANRAPGAKQHLADGTWRITSANRLHASVVQGQADRLIAQEQYNDKVAIHASKDPKALLKDATREDGVGCVALGAFSAVGINGPSKVSAFHDDQGGLVKIVVSG